MTTASLEAYDRILDKLRGKKAIVFEAICSADGVAAPFGRTIDELCQFLGWRYSTTSARVCELADAGLIKEAGMRGTQTVWERSAPDLVDELKRRRRLAKQGVQGKLVGFEGVGGVEAFGPEQTMRLTVEVTRAEWITLKAPVRVRLS